MNNQSIINDLAVADNNQVILNDLFADMVNGTHIVNDKLANKEYNYIDVLNIVQNNNDSLTKEQQTLIVDNYSYRQDTGKFDFRIPQILANSMGTDIDVLNKLSSISFEYMDKTESMVVVENTAKDTMAKLYSLKTDKNSIINIIDDEIKNKLVYVDIDVTPVVSDYKKQLYRDIREICKSYINNPNYNTYKDNFNYLIKTSHFSVNELLDLAVLAKELKNKCEEIGDIRNLGLTDLFKDMFDDFRQLALEQEQGLSQDKDNGVPVLD